MQARTDTENWCGVLQEVALPGTGADPEKFLDAAVVYANDRCWGTLSCSLMVNLYFLPPILQLQTLPCLSFPPYSVVLQIEACKKQAKPLAK